MTIISYYATLISTNEMTEKIKFQSIMTVFLYRFIDLYLPPP